MQAGEFITNKLGHRNNSAVASALLEKPPAGETSCENTADNLVAKS
ncbi:MAG TPA: hypothetical protein VIM85_02060 [Pseudomonadales bacterium]